MFATSLRRICRTLKAWLGPSDKPEDTFEKLANHLAQVQAQHESARFEELYSPIRERLAAESETTRAQIAQLQQEVRELRQMKEG